MRRAAGARAGRPYRQVRTSEGGPDPRGVVAHALLRAAIYLGALVPFIVAYSTKERALLIAPPIGLVGGLACWVLLRAIPAPPWRRALYAAVVGLILAELTWALGYWAVASLVGGAALWLTFYVLSGLVEHALAGSLDRRIGVEYGLVSLIGVLVVLVSTPWRA